MRNLPNQFLRSSQTVSPLWSLLLVSLIGSLWPCKAKAFLDYDWLELMSSPDSYVYTLVGQDVYQDDGQVPAGKVFTQGFFPVWGNEKRKQRDFFTLQAPEWFGPAPPAVPQISSLGSTRKKLKHNRSLGDKGVKIPGNQIPRKMLLWRDRRDFPVFYRLSDTDTQCKKSSATCSFYFTRSNYDQVEIYLEEVRMGRQDGQFYPFYYVRFSLENRKKNGFEKIYDLFATPFTQREGWVRADNLAPANHKELERAIDQFHPPAKKEPPKPRPVAKKPSAKNKRTQPQGQASTPKVKPPSHPPALPSPPRPAQPASDTSKQSSASNDLTHLEKLYQEVLPMVSRCHSLVGFDPQPIRWIFDFWSTHRPERRPVFDGQDLSNAELSTIETLARTLFGEMRSCTNEGSQFAMAVARIILNRAFFVSQFIASDNEDEPNLANHFYDAHRDPFVTENPEGYDPWGRNIKSLLNSVMARRAQFSVWLAHDSDHISNTKTALCWQEREPRSAKLYARSVWVALRLMYDTKKFMEQTREIQVFNFASSYQRPDSWNGVRAFDGGVYIKGQRQSVRTCHDRNGQPLPAVNLWHNPDYDGVIFN